MVRREGFRVYGSGFKDCVRPYSGCLAACMKAPSSISRKDEKPYDLRQLWSEILVSPFNKP